MTDRVEIGNFPMRFECVGGCTACCTQNGYVYLTDDDIAAASKFLKISELEFLERYCETVDGDLRLTNPGDTDCHFLEAGGCSIHAAKPLQCRTFPFWPELVERRRTWKRTARYCPGIGEGPIVPIEEIRSAAQACRDGFPDG